MQMCHPWSRAPSHASTLGQIQTQVQSFNDTLLLSPNLQDQNVDIRLEEITKIVQGALGFLVGLLEKNSALQNSDSYQSGKVVGSAAGNATAKILGGLSCTGGVAGGFTHNLYWAIPGVVFGAVCLATACAIDIYTASQKSEEEKKITTIKKIPELHEQIAQTQTFLKCVEKFKLYKKGHSDPLTFSQQATKCLAKYHALPLEFKNDTVYHRMISVFLHKLPPDHEIFSLFATLQNCKFQQINISLSEPFESDNELNENIEGKQEESEDFISEQVKRFIPYNKQVKRQTKTPEQNYQEIFNKCHQLAIREFNLKVKVPLKFIEVQTVQGPIQFT